jgi:hypothetical protein
MPARLQLWRGALRNGNRPTGFRGNTSAIIFTAILTQAPTPPLEVNSQLPPQLGEIIDRTPEKNRDLRYQSASELDTDLKRLKRDTESGAPTPQATLSGALRLTPRAKRMIAVVVALLILGLVAIPLWRWIALRRGSAGKIAEQKNLVVLPFQAIAAEAQDQAYCAGLTETVTSKLAGLPSLEVPPTSEVRQRKVDKLYAVTGDQQKALDCLQGDVQGGYPRFEIKANPELDGLRNDPRIARSWPKPRRHGDHAIRGRLE